MDFAVKANKEQTVWRAIYGPKGLRELSLLHDCACKESPSTEPDARVRKLKKQLEARLSGQDVNLDWSEFDLSGRAPFHVRIWKIMHAIPFGRTATYGEVARAAGSPNAFRACGQACGANPIILFLPCHRVVGAAGALGGFSSGVELKKKFLAAEGVDWRRPLEYHFVPAGHGHAARA